MYVTITLRYQWYDKISEKKSRKMISHNNFYAVKLITENSGV